MVRLGFAVFTDGALAIIRESEFFIVLFASPRTSFPWLLPIRKRKALRTRLLPCLPMGPQDDLHETYRNSDS